MTLGRCALAVLAAALAAPLCGCRCSPATGKAERVALLVGVDRQADPGITPLPGAANDVELMADLLVDRFDFPRRDVLILTGAEATAEGIRRAFRQHLVERSRPGTVAVFHFSGHGRRVQDTSGDEPDGYDEAIVPYDAGSSLSDAGILDDEIGEWLDALVATGASPTLIFDSCHSGTAARDDGVIVRAAPPVGGARGGGVADDGPALDTRGDGFVVVSAALSHQTAAEAVADGETPVGAFTWALVNTLEELDHRATWRTVGEAVAWKIATHVRAQTPQVDGTDIDRVVFGLSSDPPPPGSLAVHVDEHGLRLAGGALHGVVAGSTWAVHRPGADGPPPLADVIELGPVAARLGSPRDAKSGHALRIEALPPGTRAVEHARALRPDAPRVAVGDAAPQIRQALERLGLDTRADSAPLRLRIADRRARFEWLDGQPLGLPGPIEPAAISQAAWRLSHWLRLAQLDGGHPAQVDLELSGAERLGERRLRVRPGDRVQIAVQSREPMRAWYVTLLDLSDDGTITRLWPPPGVDHRLSPDTRFTVPADGHLDIVMPPGRERSIDVLKLILTSTEVDFGPLVRGEADAAGHPLVRWLSATRGAAAGTLQRSEWAVQTLRVETCLPSACP